MAGNSENYNKYPPLIGRITGRLPPARAHRARLHRNDALALQFFAQKLAGAANGLRLFTGFLFRRLFIMAAQLHFTEDALTLHLLFQGFERLVYIVVAYDDLHRVGPVLSGRVSAKIYVLGINHLAPRQSPTQGSCEG